MQDIKTPCLPTGREFHGLTQKEKNGIMDSQVEWNFQKYLLYEEGQLVKTYPSSVSPIDEAILNWIMT